MREILADPRGIVEFFYRHTSGGWFVGSWRKVLLFLARKFSYRGPMFWYKLQSTLAGKNIGGKLKGDARRHVDEKVYRKAQGQISQISGWISVGRENNCLESYVLMSSKTQSEQRGKIQPLKTVELAEYQKNCYQIYMYKSQECQRQKGCCWNIYVTTWALLSLGRFRRHYLWHTHRFKVFEPVWIKDRISVIQQNWNNWDKLEQRWSKTQEQQLEQGLQAAR